MIDTARILREARRRAGLTQRELAARAGTTQPAIARIERGQAVPRVDTLDALLEACGSRLAVEPRLGVGLDRSVIRDLRGLSPAALSRVAEEEAPYGIARRSYQPWRPLAVLDPLVRHGVRFVVIGGYGARLHGSPSVTNDTDICYSRERENITRLVRALRDLDATLRGAPPGLPFILDEQTIKNGLNFTFSTTAGALDCRGGPEGVSGFDELERNAVDMDLGPFMVKVAAISDLIRMKAAAGRPKDRIEIEVLGALQEEADRRPDPNDGRDSKG